MAYTKAAAAGIIDLRALTLVIPAVALVLLFAWLWARNKKNRKRRPGQYMQYLVPGRTAAECRGLLGEHQPDDTFAYTLEGARSGGWYIHLTLHNPTGQPLDTLFMLQFEGDNPALFSLAFVREAFGMREPVMAEAMLDEFFAKKLGAERQELD